ncbi:unnamed protein product, partial [Symbiodinium sp. CCMP2456]
MEPADRSILRATPAWKVFESFGAAFRWTDDNLYEWSFPVDSIQVFWSHSWHGDKYMKILLLLLLYNGPAAAIAATISALLMMCLQIAGFLPGVRRVGRSALDQGVAMEFGPWCTVTAGLVFLVVLLLGKPRSLVFLDQVCINQKDAEQKAKGIMSIGAFLKYSEQLLVVWDKTYGRRLWCLLELAGFLTSHEEPERKVTIRATAMAPCILGFGFAIWASTIHHMLVSEQTLADRLVLFLTRWFFFYIAAFYLCEHYRNTESMLKELSDFTVQGARCHCCNDGEPCNANVCDRAIMSRCLRMWYGSVDAFEATVRTRVRTMLCRQLGGLVFPYGWQVIVASPILWGFADSMAARGRVENWKVAAILFSRGLTWCFFLFPLILQATLLPVKCLRHVQGCAWQNRLTSIVVAFLLSALFTVGLWTTSLIADDVGSVLWICGSVTLAGTSLWALRCQARHTARMLDSIQKDEGNHGAAVVVGKPMGTIV